MLNVILIFILALSLVANWAFYQFFKIEREFAEKTEKLLDRTLREWAASIKRQESK